MKRLIVSIMMLVFMGSLAFATPDSAFYPNNPPNGFSNIGVSTTMNGMGDHVFNYRAWQKGEHKYGEKVYLVGTIINSNQIGVTKSKKPVYVFSMNVAGWNGLEFTQATVWFFSTTYWRPKTGWLVGFYGAFVQRAMTSDGVVVPVFNTYGAQAGMQPIPLQPVP